MKFKIFNAVFIITFLSVITSCNKFLDVKPKGLDVVNTVEADKSFINA